MVSRRASLVQHMGTTSRPSQVPAVAVSPPQQKPRPSSKTQQQKHDDDDDADADTDDSTAESVSSSNSFNAGFALSALRHSVFRHVKTSAQRLARKSGARLTPFLQEGSKRMLKPRQQHRRAPKALTANQQARRKRRRDNLTKLRRMIHRVDNDPFVASRVVLALAAGCLLLRAGDVLLAATMSFLGVLILHQTTQLASTHALEAWYYVGVATLVVSMGSWLVSQYMERNGIVLPPSLWDRLHDQLWFWGRGLPRLWAVVLTRLLYRDIAASKDGDDNAIETIQVELAVLRLKVPSNSMIYRSSAPPSSIVIHKGPVEVGSISAKVLLAEKVEPGSNRFQITAFSHFIEETKGSFLRIQLKEGDVIKGAFDVAAPGVHSMKVSNWFQCGEAELLIQIQSRPLATHFLFRASTLLPAMGSIALAVAFWK